MQPLESLAMLEDIRVIICDWGGTIARICDQEATRRPCVDAALAWLNDREYEFPASAADELATTLSAEAADPTSGEQYVEFDSVAFWRRQFERYGVHSPEDEVMASFVEAFWRPWLGCLVPFAGVPETLGRLREGGYPLGLLSNTAVSSAVCRAELKRQGLDHLFEFAVFSVDLGLRKPHPAIFNEALRQANGALPADADRIAPEQVLFVGDTPFADIDGAAAVGFRTVLVRTGHWQGEPGGLTTQPTLVLDSLNDLPAALDGVTTSSKMS